MALLDSTARGRISAAVQRWWSDLREACAFEKAHLAAAVDATDQWVEDNSVSFNTALPQPFRGSATPTQKSLLLCIVVMKRAGLLSLLAKGED